MSLEIYPKEDNKKTVVACNLLNVYQIYYSNITSNNAVIQFTRELDNPLVEHK